MNQTAIQFTDESKQSIHCLFYTCSNQTLIFALIHLYSGHIHAWSQPIPDFNELWLAHFSIPSLLLPELISSLPLQNLEPYIPSIPPKLLKFIPQCPSTPDYDALLSFNTEVGF